ncbi:MAG: DUF3313 family protein [Steroidobacteraceae bacterium]|nr:DUF3313 family protein [Steroidobacteraceae bacterium]
MNILRGRVSGITILVGVLVVCMLAGALAGCAADRKPEETTPDGLVRVPSRAAGGVYRAPGAPFFQYKRFIIEPLTVDFIKDWQKTHREVSDREVQRMRDEARRIFLKEFTGVLIEEGGFTLADAPAEDVLLLAPALTELDVPAPENDTVETRSLSPRRPSMTLTGELRDALTGKLVGRVIVIEPGQRYGMNELRPANRVTNAHELRLVFDKWVRLLRETLSVASTARPRVGA